MSTDFPICVRREIARALDTAYEQHALLTEVLPDLVPEIAREQLTVLGDRMRKGSPELFTRQAVEDLRDTLRTCHTFYCPLPVEHDAEGWPIDRTPPEIVRLGVVIEDLERLAAELWYVVRMLEADDIASRRSLTSEVMMPA